MGTFLKSSIFQLFNFFGYSVPPFYPKLSTVFPFQKPQNLSGKFCEGLQNCFCPNADDIAVGDECKNKADTKLWLCNGKPQSWSEPCDGKCRGFEFLQRRGQLTDYDYNYINDAYHRCPNEDKCISTDYLCNYIAKTLPGERDTCKDNFHKSRKLCDNPDKYGFSLNCTKDSCSIQCPGNKTQQCIYYEELCNGKFDCTDR